MTQQQNRNDTVTDTLDEIISNVVDLSNNTTPSYTDGTLGAGTATTAGTDGVMVVLHGRARPSILVLLQPSPC